MTAGLTDAYVERGGRDPEGGVVILHTRPAKRSLPPAICVAAAWVWLRDLVEDLASPGRDPAETGADLFPVSPGIFLTRCPVLEEVPLDVDERIQPLDLAGQLRDLSGELDVVDHLKAANEMARDSLL